MWNRRKQRCHVGHGKRELLPHGRDPRASMSAAGRRLSRRSGLTGCGRISRTPRPSFRRNSARRVTPSHSDFGGDLVTLAWPVLRRCTRALSQVLEEGERDLPSTLCIRRAKCACWWTAPSRLVEREAFSSRRRAQRSTVVSADRHAPMVWDRVDRLCSARVHPPGTIAVRLASSGLARRIRSVPSQVA